MISLSAVLGIAAIALGLVLSPGPNMIYLVSRSILQGRRAGLYSLAGIGAGFLVYLTAVTAGLIAVFTVVPPLYLAIKLAGAAYLLWLAWNALKPGGESAFTPRPLPPDPPRKLFTMGLLTCLLNPKLAILYVSLLPQFVDPARGHVAEQSLLLGLTQIVIALTVNGAIVITAGAVAAFLNKRPAWLRVQRYLMGTVLAGLAVHIVTQQTANA
ncbi:LysE family translocator [Microbispora bryophytorum]|uniref:Lysine transporter LysE n=1 Tax=Microbispora bryophytorum TaxID=1460882 RepID=A0A8H9GXY3_9ACTN|nr:LysE family translocator [Microbispora bryophytorum]MBD3135097.1 LysE family translocator [Microbispora bryophytorum]TQS08674.1 LysE family translocator [Microbispora bryophytorum]GGO10663.1 lysine transporter LysE [Microbispora bryophytorum]